jgi:5-methylcytosine-specific restriction endonuclease McrA
MKRYYGNHEEAKSRRRLLYWENRERFIVERKKYMKEYVPRIRREVISAYGGKCKCCGEGIHTFLEMDHINNKGNEHRRTVRGGMELYRWLKKNGFPKDNFQLLCSNCNMGKYRNGGTCPHKGLGHG